jgi:two-component sensor histidine kinase
MPYINIAIDAFGFLVVLILFVSCLNERIVKKRGPINFLMLLGFIMLSLLADALSWIGDGRVELSMLTAVASAVCIGSGYCAIIFFMRYLKNNLYADSVGASVTVGIFTFLCVVALAAVVGNLFYGYAYIIDDQGYYVQVSGWGMAVLHLLFPVLATIAIILITLFAKRSTRISKGAFIIYTLFPLVGVIIDSTVQDYSVTYVSFAISALIMYTSIYREKQKLIDEQKNALMLSQINPHFMYNTLTTIASMCEIAPKQAKELTVDFSSFLRRNLNTLSSEDLVPFDREIEHVECYLKIEKARFGDRLNVLYSISCRDFYVPPLSIQTLVENAVKHGITKKASGGTVKITTFDDDKNYFVEIIDDGVGFDTEAKLADGKEHLGINNVKGRLAGTCKGKLTVKSTVGIGTRVTISIPKRKGKRK